MNIIYYKDAAKTIERLDKQTRERIRKAISEIPAGDIKTLKGGNGLKRLRVGFWRILLSYVDRNTILIEKNAMYFF
ncbi:MAG: hypothetical protein LBS53_10525 [Synergistaceae bacterium]|jgi:mRNA interferase RelE/StbE|nr:hypothetical protein [Synergistaceae bacterium]